MTIGCQMARVGALLLMTALVATAVGFLAFTGRSGWPDWYWALWGPPLLLVTIPSQRRALILGIAMVAGSASGLMTWAATVDFLRR